MREIKFRAWDGSKMLVNPKFEFFQHGVGGRTVMLVDETEGLEIMQYTGLKDKNGKEIYEGDIVADTLYPNHPAEVVYTLEEPSPDKQISDLFGGVTNLNGFIYRIGSFGFRHLTDKHKAFHVQNIEVIGDIYENPDLLTK